MVSVPLYHGVKALPLKPDAIYLCSGNNYQKYDVKLHVLFFIIMAYFAYYYFLVIIITLLYLLVIEHKLTIFFKLTKALDLEI